MKKLTYIFTIIAIISGISLGSVFAQSSGPRIKGNVYGGGENAKVMGEVLGALPADAASTSVTVNSGEVCGDVYGAGKGVTIGDTPATGVDAEGNAIAHLTYDMIATVSGNAEVHIDSTQVGDRGMVWGDIYGGAALAVVTGNTEVNIAGGKFAGDVYGGGKGHVSGSDITSADVRKNTSVVVTAGEIVWNQKLDDNKEKVTWGSENKEQFYDGKFLTPHNIYAGGNIACTVGTWSDAKTLSDASTGTSSLKMTRGLLGADLLSSNEWKQAFAQHEDPHFYAFGGGYGIHTKAHSSEVQILLPVESDASVNGGDQQLARPRKAPADGDNPELELDIITDTYGVAWATVLGILGGGYNGHVEKTNVLVGDATYAHRVYGGGLGSYEGWVDAGMPADMAAAAAADGKVGTVGPLSGDPSATEPVAHVTIAGGHIFGDVFGGGAGVASGHEVNTDGVWSLDRSAEHTTFTDFTEIARVNGNTLVETTSYQTYLASIGTDGENILATHPNKDSEKDNSPLKQRAQIFGNVYGGGDVANVSGNTQVGLYGGDVFGYTFGAGLGRLVTEAKNYTSIGNVTGSSTVITADLVGWEGTSLPSDYVEPYKPTAWDDIYGGGRNGVTDGDAMVNINGGFVGNNIFGGGLGNVDGVNITSADVKGNTTVTVTGGQYQWREMADVNGNKKTFIDDQTITQEQLLNRMGFATALEGVKDFFDYRTSKYARDHSIYGGGNVACKVGTYGADAVLEGTAEKDKAQNVNKKPTGIATVHMNHGLFADKDIAFIDEDFNLATLCRYLACENAENTQFGVFGGGYGAQTKVSETKLNLQMGQGTGDPLLWLQYFGTIQQWYENLSSEEQQKLFGGAVGENAYNRFLTARMAKSINVPSHTVLTAAGGGLAGYVAGNTAVTMNGHSGALRVYGGGIGMKPTPEEIEAFNPGEAAALTYGQVGGNTMVNVNAGVVVKNVFGGGAGIESQRKTDDSYIDFPGMAHVLGKTDVTVSGYTPGTMVFGMVFGGGDVANVGTEESKVSVDQIIAAKSDKQTSFTEPQTTVTVNGGCVFQQVFAGGSGRTQDVCSGTDGYRTLGAVYGNTRLVIDQSQYTAEEAAAANLMGQQVQGWTTKVEGGDNQPWLWNAVYGGGQNGTVYGNTDVQIAGGNLGYDIFGGGWGNKTLRYNVETGEDEEVVTSADVTQNTNVSVTGGLWCLSQSWLGTERQWKEVNKMDDKLYSPQYEPDVKRFNINHCVYGGGNVACAVGSNAYVLASKGMIPDNAALGHAYTGALFDQPEWKSIYDKHASPHFSIFGGGYGVDTKVDNTHVLVNIEGGVAPSADGLQDVNNYSANFVTLQSLMDVIGGGYEGEVTDVTNVEIDGHTFLRNAFGGAYYATVGSTKVNIIQANMDNVYGGGMMGDVKNDVTVTVGTEGDDVRAKNAELFILQDVYGANDVAGYVGAEELADGSIKITENSEGVKLRLNGGHIYGSVYGGGNGNYLYQIDENVTKVTAVDNYRITDEFSSTVYKVPLRASDFPSLTAMSNQQKMANVISYRPSAMKVDIDFKGNTEVDRLLVDGSIFGGGNSATINDYDGIDSGDEAKVHINVGSHIIVGGVFLGSDGDALFDSKQGYMTYFPIVNSDPEDPSKTLTLFEEIDWTTPENSSIPLKFLPTAPEQRPQIYKNNIDLYFMPVEMAVMPEVTWGKSRLNNSVWVAQGKDDEDAAYAYNPAIETPEQFTDAEIGTFCCGGNRGNMDTKTNFHINFPAGLTITDKIVGGCNNANYQKDIYDSETMKTQTLNHTGGFLLGSHGVGTGRTPQIHLTLRNKFKITETETIGGVEYYKPRGNVFGGCYERGVVRGDILIEVFSNMLHSDCDAAGNVCGLDSALLRRTTDKGITVGSVYGAGYGPESWVRGDTEVRLGDETQPSAFSYSSDGRYHVEGSSCNYIFGGGRQGNVIGNTNVQIHNGRVAGCVIGASYAGMLYGSAQTMVGFPELYYRAKVSRSYDILRADEDTVHAKYLDDNLHTLIQKKVYYTKGDLVTAAAYNGIRDRIVENQRLAAEAAHSAFVRADAVAAAETELANYFDMEHSVPAANNWSNVNIQIDKAVYGGGYALATGSGSYTVMKYTDEHKFLDADILDTYGFDGTAGWDNTHDETTEDFTKYGGNTFVIVGDISENYDVLANTTTPVTAEEKDRDHIKLSSSQLKEVHASVGSDMFGLFKELTNREVNPNKYDSDGGWDVPAHLEEGKQLSGQYMKITTEYTYDVEDKKRGSKFFEFTGEGGIYGDGRLSISEGFRVCDVIGYGYNGSTPKAPSLMNCIHRFDIARFKDCCISLLGDRDYTSVEGSQVNAVAYSMARVAEIQMESAIDQTSNYKTTENKHSRNYVGLSSAQFDLSAVKSNDIFSADADAALYHNKNGVLISTAMEIEGADGQKFPAALSYYNVKKWYLSEYKEGIEQSNYYDDINAQVRNERQFQLRNSATARNMFGIFSGYALNVHSTHYDEHKVPTNYYGPVVGVFEVDLIGTRAGEAGGYAYAQNIHRENAKDGEGHELKDADGKEIHSFLETSGNFVFPATEVRKVVDNCTPTAYNSVGRDGAEGHYWYVTGFKYYYNATITGYTYDGKTKFFESDNSATKRLVLTGTKAGQTVQLKNFHWLPRHVDPYYSTVEEYNQAWGTTLSETDFAALPDEKKARCDIEHYYLTTAYQSGDGSNLAANKEAWNEVITADDRKASPYYNLSLSLSEFGNYMETTNSGVGLPYISLMPQDTYKWSEGDEDEKYKIYIDQEEDLINQTDRANPVLGLRLADCMDNNGKDEHGVTYYAKHLADPCVAKIVLTVPAVNSSGDPLWSNYTEVVKTRVTDDNRTDEEYNKDPYYTFDANGDYYKISLAEAKDLAGKGINVFEVQKAVYESVGTNAFNSETTYYTESGGVYTVAEDVTEANYDSKKSSLYYEKVPAAHQEHYVYDITLTIKYIKGPSYEGRIDVENCALPGEMIRLSHENLKIESDEISLPHNGSFWTIGPGKKVWNNEADHTQGYHWELIDEKGVKTRKAFDSTGKPIEYYYNDPDTRNLYFPYNPYVNDPLDEFYKKVVVKEQDKAVSPIMRQGVYHDFVNAEKPEYFVPAYYFMNGYVAQYSFTVNGIDEVFTTTIHPEDTLLVHNYHRMAMAANSVLPDGAQDIKLSHAMKEYRNVPDLDDPDLTDDQRRSLTEEWQIVHKRPRVYIQDVDDLKAFAEYLRREVVNSQEIHIRDAVPAYDDGDEEHHLPAYDAANATYVRRYATDCGRDVEFFLMNDIDLTGQSWTAVNFKGILHGNGHVITGLKNTESLFNELGDDVRIYNLGLPKGKIATVKGNAKYSCCYTYDTNQKDTNDNLIHYVYRMDGKEYTGYTEHDWRTGRVAYDLNEFYLAERLDRNTDAVGEEADKDTHVHAGYVEGLYADGEYRFSRYSTNEKASEYLRSKPAPYYSWGMGIDQEIIENPDIVSNHYYSYDNETHSIAHKVDEPRAYYDEAGTFDEYRPLIDEALCNTAVDPAPAVKKNDYIFFGQTINRSSYDNALGTVGTTLPHVISASSRTSAVGSYEDVTHAVADQTNRVWRAYGFYRSKADDAFHFNKKAWALHPELTAIDFTGLHDVVPTHKWVAGYAPATATATTAKIFYPMVMDMPEDGLSSFDVDSNLDYGASTTASYSNAQYGHVTQNLLVYNAGENVFAYKDVDNSAESGVLYHNLVKSGDPATFSTDYFHLVDKQDFNAPIAFNVNTRAWYERLPLSYRNVTPVGYGAGSAWEGIVLPFTATKVTAEVNGEISHFYGSDSLHHEYWLRGLMGVKAANGLTLATFDRPAVTGDYYFDSRQVGVSYTYPKNKYFTSLYNYNPHYDTRDDEGDDTMDNHDKAWYAEAHTFADYVPLTAAVPYIVAFPGDDFYEFSMESEYSTGAYGRTKYHQIATFERGATTIPVSDDVETSTTVTTYKHQGTYLHQTSAYGINRDGTAFGGDDADQTVLPFRTYMAAASTSAPTRGIIAIGNIGGEEEDPVEPAKPSLELQYRGREVIVTSSYSMMVPLEVFNSVGQLILIHEATTGTTSFELPYAGAFIINGEKVMIR